MTPSTQKKNGIQLPFLIIDFVKYDISNLLDKELRDLKTKIDMSIIELDSEILEAQGNAHNTGKYASPGWYAGISRLKKIRGQQSQCIQAELGARARAIRAKSRTLESCFVEVANKTLSKEEFMMILGVARQMVTESATN